MTEEQIKALAEEYIKDYDPMFRKAVRVAFIEGMQTAMEYMKEKLMELLLQLCQLCSGAVKLAAGFFQRQLQLIGTGRRLHRSGHGGQHLQMGLGGL